VKKFNGHKKFMPFYLVFFALAFLSVVASPASEKWRGFKPEAASGAAPGLGKLKCSNTRR